jgi:UDP-N-acetylglucosamine--N-acetylmuramyl-(pentapeptide) pyrophosphoryl-undecaprenol N-acetylglucosamine transferase
MAEIVPEAVAALPEDARARLAITQQTRSEDMERVRTIYGSANVNAELAPFFADLPARIANAHFVIARSGASTVSELAVIGRPSLLVPLPQSLDGDQAANAKILEETGAAEISPQSAFTPAFLAERLTELVNSPDQLAQRARAAKRAGGADAAERLADLMMTVAREGAAQRRQG